jgi:hypothetical protein
MALPLGLGAASCGYDAGGDYAVSVTWLINGIPPSRQQCEDYGIDRIRFRVKSRSHDRTLEAPCTDLVTLSDGFDYGGFDTTFAFSYDTSYEFEVSMLTASGRVATLQGSELSYSDRFRISDRYASYYELRPLELFSPFGDVADVVGSYTVLRKPASEEVCSDAGIAKVYLDLASATDPDFADYQELGQVDCAEGVIQSGGALAVGEYFIRYVAVDGSDEILSTQVPVDDAGNFQIYRVDSPGTLQVTRVDLP